MTRTPTQKTLFQKQIPTVLGLIILVVALIGGVFLIGEGPGVFAPRASAETTPRKVRITNVTDSSFTISFLTQDSTPGFVKYGTEANRLNSQSSDDRDQLTGTVGQYKTHHITVRGLNPNTQYHYELGTGSGASFDNSGTPFTIKTAQRSGAPSAAKTAYGMVNVGAGTPADGAIVYLSIQGVGEMSSLVKATGSWAIPLSNARNIDGSGYATIGDDDVMNVLIQGDQEALLSQFSIPVAQSQPVADIVIGQSPDNAMAMNPEPTNEVVEEIIDPTLISENPDTLDVETIESEMDFNEATDSAMIADSTDTATQSASMGGTGTAATSSASTNQVTEQNAVAPGGLGSLIEEPTPEKTELNLDSDEGAVLTTGNPIIRGTAVPGVTINIVVNSDTQITQQLIANEDGTFELDIAALSEQLEPGEHSATYSYMDPQTNQIVTKTVTFTVEEPATGGSQMIAQATQPYSTSSPVPVGTSSSTATNSATATSSATGVGGATRSAMPATTSAIPVSGSVGTTLALVFGGLFFILAGGWSFWLAHEIERV